MAGNKHSNQGKQYAIRETLHYFAPRVDQRDYRRTGPGEVQTWPTRAEAEAEVARLDSRVYELDSNESGRPSYEVVRLSPTHDNA